VLAVTLTHNMSSRCVSRPATMPAHDANTSAIIQGQEAPKRDLDTGRIASSREELLQLQPDVRIRLRDVH
jgi:hypothetical protein